MLGGLGPMPLELRAHAESGWSAEQHARACADLVACTRTLPFARLYVSVDAFAVRRITDYQGRNGSGRAHAPTLVRNGAGDYTLTWELAYPDAFGVYAPTNLRYARARVRHATNYTATAVLTAPHICRVYMYRTHTNVPSDSYFILVVG